METLKLNTNHINFPSGNRSRLIAIALIGINLCITLFLAASLNIWIDEAYSLNTTGKDFSYALNQALYFELQPPGYFLILELWRNLNSSIFFARLFSILCIVSTLAIAPKLSQKYLPDIHPGWITAAIALNPLIVWAAVEIRLYAFVILLSALLLWFFFDGYLSEKSNPLLRWGYAGVAILSLYTQYFFAFLLVAQGITLLILRRWQALRNYIIQMFVVAIAFLPLLLLLPNQVSAHTKIIQKTSSVSAYFKRLIWLKINYFLSINWTWLQDHKENSKTFYLIICLMLGLMFLIYKKPQWLKQQDIALWIMTVVTMVVLVAVTIKLPGKELIEARHTAGFFIPVIFSVFSLIKVVVFPWVKSSDRLKILLIWTLIALFFNLTTLVLAYQPMAKRGDFIRVANYIMEREKPNQPILTFVAEIAIPLSYHYSGQNTIVPVPREEDFKVYDLHENILKHEREIWQALSQVPGEHSEIWLVRNRVCNLWGIDFNCQVMNDFVSKYYSVKLHQKFAGTDVELLKRNPNKLSESNRLIPSIISKQRTDKVTK
jgi:uncharacterized membrane protein